VTVASLLEFARGPLFVVTFSFMTLGLARRFLSQLWQFRLSMKRVERGGIDVKSNVRESLLWLLPMRHLYRNRPIISLTSFVFHVGLLLVPLLLLNHIDLWRGSLGISWPGIGPELADVLTLLTVAGALVLLGFRTVDRAGRSLSKPGDYVLLLAVSAPFISGFMAMHPAFNPLSYDGVMLVHVLSSEVLFILLPTTKLSHGVLFIFDRFSSDVFWKMPEGAGDRVARELYGEEPRV
jgi:nitrate reductase gamma subunit